MSSLELHFPMDSPEKDSVAADNSANFLANAGYNQTDDSEYCLWEPDNAGGSDSKSPKSSGSVSSRLSPGSVGGRPSSGFPESGPQTTRQQPRIGGGLFRLSPDSRSRRQPRAAGGGGGNCSPPEPAAAGPVRKQTLTPPEAGNARASPTFWPDTRFGFRRRACTVSVPETEKRRNLFVEAADRPSSSVARGGSNSEHLSSRAISCSRKLGDYCEYDLSSSAPSAPGTITSPLPDPYTNTTNLRRYTVAKTYFPSRSSSSFSFRGSGKNLNCMKNSTSYSDRLSTCTSKVSTNPSMGEMVATKSCETVNKESGNQTLSRIKKSIGKLVNRTRSRVSDTEATQTQTQRKDSDASWKACPIVKQTVADSKEKGLPIIPMPLYNNLTPKVDEKKTGVIERPRQMSECTTSRHQSESSCFSVSSSDTLCTQLSDCTCTRCTACTRNQDCTCTNCTAIRTAENSLYMFLPENASDESEPSSFSRTRSECISMQRGVRGAGSRSSGENNVVTSRRETVSEGSNSSLAWLQDCLTAKSGATSSEASSNSGDFPAVNRSKVKSGGGPDRPADRGHRSPTEYLIMQLGHKRDHVVLRLPDGGKEQLTDKYLVMDLSRDNGVAPKSLAVCSEDQSEYLLMSNTSTGSASCNTSESSLPGSRTDMASIGSSAPNLSAQNEYLVMDSKNLKLFLSRQEKDLANVSSEPLKLTLSTGTPIPNPGKVIKPLPAVTDNSKASATGCDEYLVMNPTEPASNQGHQDDYLLMTSKSNQEEYLDMNLSDARKREADTCVSAGDSQDEYLVMAPVTSTSTGSQHEAQTSQAASAGQDEYLLMSVTPGVSVTSGMDVTPGKNVTPGVSVVTAIPKIWQSESSPAGEQTDYLVMAVKQQTSENSISEYMLMDSKPAKNCRVEEVIPNLQHCPSPSVDNMKKELPVPTPNTKAKPVRRNSSSIKAQSNQDLLFKQKETLRDPSKEMSPLIIPIDPVSSSSSPTVLSSIVIPSASYVVSSTAAPTLTTPSGSSSYKPFPAFRLPFSKQLMIPKPGGSGSKGPKSPVSPPLNEQTSPGAGSDPKLRLNVPGVHKNSVSQKLSPITRRLSGIKLKSVVKQQDKSQAATAGDLDQLSPGSCYLDIGGVLQDVTVIQDVLQDPRIAGAYSPENGSVRRVSFNDKSNLKIQDSGGGPSNSDIKNNYMETGSSTKCDQNTHAASSKTTDQEIRSKSLTDEQVVVLQSKINYLISVAQDNREYRRHRKANKNKEDYVMVNMPTSKPQNIKTKSDKKHYLSLSN